MSNPIGEDIREINRKTIEDFRAHKGGGPFEGRALLILTTRGRVTGRPHTTPMMYVIEGDHLLVMASAAGAPHDPEWFRNLLITPDVTVEVGDQTYIANARPTEGAEYDAVWSQIKKNYPFFVEHEQQAGRKIPVVALERT
ncbi:nitroreductase/quinone reductase family protein [Herbidospora mongoliensis]|uniref:nitroreductase/quinone reductase family protein n=1 Tax=Herbidospora mongoliensis TaxID=688067 RepID=UPI00082CCF6F|nr:nitroreductase/quinone reductase family protein [Herbidospora mongoliensis]